MVTRVVGKVNSVNVIFENDHSGGRWRAIVPPNLHGEYVIDVAAYDDAGNMAYTTKWLFILDANRTQAYIIPLRYNSQAKEWDKYVAFCVRRGYAAVVIRTSNGGG